MSSLQASLLAKLSATSTAAKAAAARRKEEKHRAAVAEEERKSQLRLQKLREEGQKIVSRNVSRNLRSQGVRKRQPGGPSRRGRGARRNTRSAGPDDSDDDDNDGVKDDLSRTSRREVSRRNRGGAVGVARRRQAAGPQKPLPGMDFVVRKTKKKEIRVPHTSDYSDMFGEKFLRGIDLKVLQDKAEESAIATKEAQEILNERKVKNKKAKEVAQRRYEEEKVLEREGKLTTKVKNSRRCEASALDWEVVDTPIASNAPRPPEINGRPASSTSEPARKFGDTSKKGGGPSIPNKSDTEARKRALQERLQLTMPAGPAERKRTPPVSAGKRSRAYRGSDGESEEDEYAARKRRKAVMEPPARKRSSLSAGRRDVDRRDVDRRGSKRRAAERDFDERRGSRGGKRRVDDDDEPPRRRRRSVPSDEEEEERRYRRPVKETERGDISDDWSEEDDDDDDDDDGAGGSIRFNDLDEYEEEELESARVGALEDKKEWLAEKNRKLVKEKRRDS